MSLNTKFIRMQLSHIKGAIRTLIVHKQYISSYLFFIDFKNILTGNKFIGTTQVFFLFLNVVLFYFFLIYEGEGELKKKKKCF